MDTNAHELAMRLQYRETPVDENVTRQNRQAVLDVFDKIAVGDFDALWTIFDEDVIFYEAPCLPYGGVFKGLAATKQAFARLATFYEKTSAVVEAIVAGEDMVIVYEIVKYTAANGNTGSMPVSELLRFRSGKVIEWRAFYFDSNMTMQKLTQPA